MIRTVVFDFGNVLGFFSHRQAAEQLAAHSDLSPEAILEFLDTHDPEHRYESGLTTTAEMIAALRRHCRLRCDDAALKCAYADMFSPNHDVCALVPRLRQRYRLVLLSNTNEMHCEQFSQQFADTLSHFHTLIYSHEVGARKPQQRIYDICLEQTGAAPAECLFIDDLPANIAAAQRHGWHGVVYQRGDDLAARLAEYGISF